MANLEVLALDTAVPQIRAPGAGDGYSVPRDMTLASGTTLAAQAVTSTSLGTTGNLTFSGTAQRITGDFSNATVANRLMFQSSTTNGNTQLELIPNGTATTSNIIVSSSSADPANTSFGSLLSAAAEVRLQSGIRGTGSYQPMTFWTGGGEKMRLDTSGNLLVGTATSVGGVRLTSVGGGVQLSGGTTAQEGVRIQRATGYATFTGINNDNNAYNGLQFFTSASAAATIDTSGNVGIGTASPSGRLDAEGSSGATYFNFSSTAGGAASVFSLLGGTASEQAICFNSGALRFGTVTGKNAAGFTERMRIDSSGNVGIGTTSFGASSQVVLAIANATAVPTGNPTGGGVLYVEAGALKYRGSSGTVTTIANA